MRDGPRQPSFRTRTGVVALLAAVGLAAAAPAQEQERRLERAFRQSERMDRLRLDSSLNLSERALLDVGGYFTYTFLNLDDANGDSRRLNQYDTTLYARASIDEVHNFFFRSSFRYRDFSPGDSFDGRGDSWAEPFVDRYWYELDLTGSDGPVGFDLRIGRQFVDWGAGLALSEQLIAARPGFVWGTGWRFVAEGLAGVTPPDESIIDFDSSRSEFNRRTLRGFYGGLFRATSPTNQSFYAYGLYMADYNSDDGVARFGILSPVDFQYDAVYLGVGVDGSLGPNLLYLGEFVYETGKSQSDPLRDPVQFAEDISAFAARAQLTYQFHDRGLTRLQVETLLASGDGDRILPSETVAGNLAGTKDHSFNSLGFANTGLAFATSLNNLMSLRVGASTFPLRTVNGFERMQVGADVLVFGKFNQDAPIDEDTLDKNFLGTELDLYANYRVTSDFALGVRYGVFFPSDAIVQNPHTRHFVLLSATLSF